MHRGRIASGFLTRIRDAWVIVGVVLVLSLALEVGYRIQASARRLLVGGRALDPQIILEATPAWWDSLMSEQDEVVDAVNWAPFAYHSHRGYGGKYLSIDERGVRGTVQSALSDWPSSRSIFFFGGSAMWGDYQRDATTIPSLAAKALSGSGFDGVTVVNYGEHNYALVEEINRLIGLLRRGERPSVVVFYDGIDDVFRALGDGSEDGSRYEMAMRVYNDEHSLNAELGAGAAMASGLRERSLLVARLSSMFSQEAPRAYVPARSRASQVAQDYREAVRVVLALADAYDFQPLFVWQPTIYRTTKQLTPAESRILQAIVETPFDAYLNELHPLVAEELRRGVDWADSSSPPRFVDLTGVFNAESAQMYVDIYGHTTERANELIVERLTPHLIGALESASLPERRLAHEAVPPTAELGDGPP